MQLDRRKFLIRSIGAAICAGAVPAFLPSLLPASNDLMTLTNKTLQFPNVVYDPAVPEGDVFLIHNSNQVLLYCDGKTWHKLDDIKHLYQKPPFVITS